MKQQRWACGWASHITLAAISVIGLCGRSWAGQSTPYSGSPATIPGTILAANFDNGGEGVAYYDTTAGNSGGAYRQTDVDIQQSSDGSYNVGWIAAAEWLNYTVSVGSAGAYTVALRVASPNGGSLHVGFNQASNVWTTVTIPNTGGWQAWTTVTLPVTLGAGQQLLTLYFDTGGYNVETVQVTAASGPSGGSGPSGSTPYLGTAAPIPGTIQAANFDNGGQGVAYYDTTPGNTGGAYRQTDVDIQASSEGAYNIGWITPTEWLNYTVTVASAGAYTVALRVASPIGGSLHVGFNGAGSVSTAVSIPNTGGWQTWTTVDVPVRLGPGQQVMTLYFDTGGYNLENIQVAAGGSGSGSGGSPTVLPVLEWNIEVDDSSLTHAQLAMDQAMAVAPRPQVVVIEEAWLQHFNDYLAELEAQTGQTWYGTFATECPPGDWNGTTCTATPTFPALSDQGVGIFSTFPIVSTSSMFFPFPDCYVSARAAVRAALNINGTIVQVFATHLQTGGCENDAQSRYSSMAMLKTWAAGYSTPQLVAGDFNADRDQIDTTQGMLPNFIDSWGVVGSGPGYTDPTPSPTMKLDYWLSDASLTALPVATEVVTGPGTLSDHYPLEVVFSVP